MNDVNLAPWREYLKDRERHFRWLEIFGGLCFALLLLLLLYWFLCHQMTDVKARLSSLNERLMIVDKHIEEARTLYKVAEYQKIPEMDLSYILGHQQRILTVLQTLAHGLSSSARLTQVHVDKGQWRIEGIALTVPIVWSYVAYLKSHFKQINVLELKEKEGKFFFQLNAEVLS